MFGIKRFARAALVATAVLGVAAPAVAEQQIGSYWAYIGNADLYNSKGQRLTAPWQVLRQDRANVHRFGVSQPGDEGDRFFGSINNRAAMEQMIMRGYIAPGAARILMNGGATVHVRIFGQGNTATSLQVTVSE